ncbi:hypothetical protein PTSG_05402 [Salpingoeca rosetta]|uniref:Aminotransferase class V domain-containing protein n=1 Tax=Salpingoeca rosetta (strain ATCC 50818 / BSB-021) TaxID=946362 RepID=F2UAB9_SALR5|nr:uncharacterized protein PTSG_05402 [Salpingoeca rosetta]EGD73694.1 hypothetical protein PTSG_05402 [Salpingoeca rosetta]|eukprot:XP_004993975.1 hypothetical protein PTSG_05402 [Salpingoeca rosetta]
MPAKDLKHPKDTPDRHDRLIPAVPAYATAGIYMFFYHLALSFLHLIGVGRPCPYKLGVRRDNNTVVGQSCRSLFYVLWNSRIPEGSRVLVTPFHHSSFVRMMRDSGRELVVCEQRNNELVEPTEYGPRDFNAVVITHMLGRDFECEWLKRWKRENPALLVIEDRVQGGLLSMEDPDLCDVSLYSTGQDKLPNFMGGGFARVHSANHPTLYEDMATALEALPFESAWARFTFLVKKIPTVLMYNWRPATIAADALAHVLGFSRCALTDTYRKKNPGFMHHGFAIRPSAATLQSMDTVLETDTWEEMQRDCTRKFRLFLDNVDADVRAHVKPFAADTSCCYFFVRLPDCAESREMLAQRGIITISNQTYIALSSKHAPILDDMVLLPSLMPLRSDEIKTLAKHVSDTWRVVGADKMAQHTQPPVVHIQPTLV